MRWVVLALLLTGCAYARDDVASPREQPPSASSPSRLMLPSLHEFPHAAGALVMGVKLHEHGVISLKGRVTLPTEVTPGAGPVRTCLGAQVGAPATMTFADQRDVGIHVISNGRTFSMSQATSERNLGHVIDINYAAQSGEIVPVIFVISDAFNASVRGTLAELVVEASVPSEVVSLEFTEVHCVMSLDELEGENLVRVAGVTHGTGLLWEHPERHEAAIWLIVAGNGGFRVQLVQEDVNRWSGQGAPGGQENSVLIECCLPDEPWRLEIPQIAGSDASLRLAVVDLPSWAAAAIRSATAERPQ